MTEADRILCGKRLTGRVVIMPASDDINQTYLPGTDVDYQVDGVFDVKRFSASPKQIGASLSFSIASIDIEQLSHFAQGSGRLIVDGVEVLQIEPKKTKAKAGALKSNEPWRNFPLERLGLAPSIIKSLNDADIKTMGELATYSADKRLTDIEGIGPGKAQQIEDATMQYWAENKPEDEADPDDEDDDLDEEDEDEDEEDE